MCVCVSASTHNVDVVLEQWSSSESGREEYEERPDDGGVRTATLCGRCDKTSLLQRPHYTMYIHCIHCCILGVVVCKTLYYKSYHARQVLAMQLYVVSLVPARPLCIHVAFKLFRGGRSEQKMSR